MEESGESFNMAVATLMRLDGILKRMQLISEMMQGIPKQRLMIEEARHFILNSSPLMGNVIADEVQEYKNRIFKIKIPTKVIKGKRIEYYNPNIENEIMSILIEIQIKIKNFFMPPAKKKRLF